MSVLSEFKTFIMRGNVIDLAVGVIIGAAFNSIVTALIEHIITPLMLKPLMEAAHVSTLQEYTWHGAKVGLFISSVITFLITAFMLFLIVKGMNKAKRKQDAEPVKVVELTKSEILLTEIRDSLKR